MQQVDLDLSRVHFLGRIPYDRYRELLQVSTLHLYLTYPFVLSWSMLEAMSSGCLVMGSATAPVQEVISEGVNGILVDFFDYSEWAKKINFVLSHREDFESVKLKARQTVVDRYSKEDGLSKYLRLFEEVLG